jgi:hypothetical protein
MPQSLLFAALSLFAILQPPADGSALLAKHRAYLGWTFGDGTLTSWRSETRYKPSSTATPEPNRTPDAEATPGRGLVVTTLRRGMQFRETASRGEIVNVDDTGFTGRVFWSARLNNFTVTVLRDRARMMFTENMLDSEEISTLPGEARGTAKIGTLETRVVRVTPSQGFPVDLYVDADGAYRREIVAPDTDFKRTIDIDRYIEVLPGKKVVGEYHATAAGSYVVDKFEPNVAISNEDLHPPEPRPVWSFGDSAPIPIDIVSHTAVIGKTGGRAVMFRASINGQEGTFLLDSGASVCVLFGAFADAVKLDKIGSSAIGTLMAGRVETELVSVDQLKIGNNVLRNVIFERAHNDAFKEFDGIIGFDVLAKAIVDVDIRGHKMTILDPAKYEAHVQKDAAVLPVDLTSRQPAVEITIGKGFPAYPLLDTGNDYLLLLSYTLSKSGKISGPVASIPFGADSITQRSAVGGTAQSRETAPCIRPFRIMIGPIPYENGLTCFADPRTFGPDGGIIGFDFLRHFNWTFDYPHQRLILTPNGDK